MSWWGPDIDDEQRELLAMLDAFAAERDVVLDDAEPDAVRRIVAELADLGIWTLGVAEEAGGGGADPRTSALAFERLGRSWPALGWASVQAHAAVDLLSADPSCAETVAGIVSGETGVAVVSADGSHVHLEITADRVTGVIDRVDAAHNEPAVLVLVGPSEALLVPADQATSSPVRRTGLGGALTRRLQIDAPLLWIAGAEVASVQARLLRGAAAVAAGIAGAASDDAVAYAGDRRQFGAALTAIPVVRQSLVDQIAGVAGVLHAALSDATGPVQPAVILRDACEAAIDVAAAALQSHGGYGYLTEYAAERRLRDAVSLRAAADVSPAMHRAALAAAGVASEPTKESR